jgi:hypothetical protein
MGICCKKCQGSWRAIEPRSTGKYSVILSLGNPDICRLAYKGAWMLEWAIFSIRSRQTLFCNIQGEYMSIFIGNHTKIKKLLRNVWVF